MRVICDYCGDEATGAVPGSKCGRLEANWGEPCHGTYRHLPFNIQWDGSESNHETIGDAAQEIVDYCFNEIQNDKISITDEQGREYNLRLTAELYVPGEENDERKEAETGLALLCQAREAFKRAGAVKTVVRVRSAISSAKGAVRNAEMKPIRKRHKEIWEQYEKTEDERLRTVM